MHKASFVGLTSAGIVAPLLLGSLAHGQAALAMKEETPEPTFPDVIELRDGNSILRTDILKFNTSEAWLVDDVDILFTDLYFFNLGNNPAQRELRLEDFDQISLQRPAQNQFLFTGESFWFGGNLTFTLNTTLYGGPFGSFWSRREDLITVSFTGPAPLPFSLYSYIDYDLRLDQRFDNDTLRLDGNTLTQTDGTGIRATLTSVGTPPSAVQFAEYPFLISALYDDTRTNLGPQPGPLSMQGPSPQLSSQPLVNTDGTAALQFNDTLSPGKSLSFNFIKEISKDKTPAAVPEPTVLMGLGLVTAAIALLKRS
jgi:hypothetical protein